MPNTQTTLNSKKTSAGVHVHTDLESMKDQIKDRYEELIENATDTSKNSLSLIKRYPFYALAGVVAIGAAAAIFVKSRRSHTL